VDFSTYFYLILLIDKQKIKNMNTKTYLFLLIWAMLQYACSPVQSNQTDANADTQSTSNLEVQTSPPPGQSRAIFAGGCFWCTEAVFERVEGVKDVFSGYTGGKETNPTYEEVGSGSTGHAEAVMVFYDPKVVSYETLLEIFFATHDPTQLNRQGPDVGKQYRSEVFYQNEEEQKVIESQIKKLNDSGKYTKSIATQVAPFKVFYTAEDYHQDYYELHPENPYVQQVTVPKVKKFLKEFPDKLKSKYKS
jgi:peptide-methionine (S)-S-oxide reductase